MDAVAVQRPAVRSRALRGRDGTTAATWALAAGLTIYLGLQGGGYDIVVRNQVGLIVWWIVLLAAAWGLLPRARFGRAGWAGLALLGGFVLWSAIATTWSLSSERSLQELSRIATYLGIFLLALEIHRDRERAIRDTVNAVAAAIVVIAVVALVARLFPGTFPASQTTGAFLGGAQARLSWPLNYWNGVAALVTLGLPLLLSIATSARTLWGQAVAAAAIPVIALCAYLTASRGGAIAAGVAVLAFFALAPNRFPKLATALVAAGGSAILVAGAHHRSAIQNGLTGHLATVQGRQLLVTILLVSGGVGLAQTGIGLASRHGTLPRLLSVSKSRARLLLGFLLAAGVAASLAFGVPHRLSHAWHDFKTNATHGGPATGTTLGARLGSASGEGRYQYWQVAVKTAGGHPFTGAGPGTFQLLWLPRAPFDSHVINAHSLYVETLAEVGIIGLALLGCFLLVAIGAAVRQVVSTEYEARAQAAGTAAALLAFCTSAIVDWDWQLPVVPVAFLLLAAAVLAPAAQRVRVRLAAEEESSLSPIRYPLLARGAFVLAGLGSVAAIAVPLATTNSVRQSQSAVNSGRVAAALGDARSGARLESGAASPQLQLALVLELRRNYDAAIAAAHNATQDEPQNWTGWLVLSRLEAESGHVAASVAAYRRARSLNPKSPLFST